MPLINKHISFLFYSHDMISGGVTKPNLCDKISNIFMSNTIKKKLKIRTFIE